MKKQNFKKSDEAYSRLKGNERLNNYNFFLKRIKSHRFIFNFLPFVEDVALCNTVANKTARRDSDIDLLIILKRNRFFLGRFILTFILQIFSLRRHSNKIKRRYCLSFFVSNKDLNFTDILIENDVYFYYWFYNLKFLYSNTDLQSKLIIENKKWFKEETFKFENLNYFKKNLIAKFLEFFLNLSMFNILEKYIEKYQLRRSKEKYIKLGCPFGVVIKPGFLKFHVEDIRESFRDDYLSFLER